MEKNSDGIQLGFPKLQYSLFVKNGRDGQYVVRSNDQEEFGMLVALVNSRADEAMTGSQAVAQRKPAPEQTVVAEAKGCPICGGELTFRSGISKKTNKPYKAEFCASGDPSHTQWLK